MIDETKEGWMKMSKRLVKTTIGWTLNKIEASIDIFSQIMSHGAKQIEDKYHFKYPYNHLLLFSITISILILTSWAFGGLMTKRVVLLISFTHLIGVNSC